MQKEMERSLSRCRSMQEGRSFPAISSCPMTWIPELCTVFAEQPSLSHAGRLYPEAGVKCRSFMQAGIYPEIYITTDTASRLRSSLFPSFLPSLSTPAKTRHVIPIYRQAHRLYWRQWQGRQTCHSRAHQAGPSSKRYISNQSTSLLLTLCRFSTST
jgi:hypothetical protein